MELKNIGLWGSLIVKSPHLQSVRGWIGTPRITPHSRKLCQSLEKKNRRCWLDFNFSWTQQSTTLNLLGWVANSIH